MSQGQKELERLMGIVREHAKATLAKPVTQRESHLAFCRNNWKRYAIGINRRTFEAERFAAVMDRATRDLIALIEESGGVEQLEDRQRLQFARDSVEGAMESVIVYEAAIPAPEDVAAAAAPVVPGEDAGPESVETTPEPPPPEPALPEIDTAEALAAETEDRQTARYGFGVNRKKVEPEAVEVRIDTELQRRVQAAVRARLQAMPKSDDDR